MMIPLLANQDLTPMLHFCVKFVKLKLVKLLRMPCYTFLIKHLSNTELKLSVI